MWFWLCWLVLPSEYDMLVTVLENADAAPSLDEVLAKALLVEGKAGGSVVQAQQGTVG